jgi:nucleoside-diphosphate kinase
LAGEIFARLKKADLKVETCQQLLLSARQAAELYQPHEGKDFYPGLIKFIISGAVMACVVTGENAIARLRQLMGDTDPTRAKAGSIRGDLREESVTDQNGIMKNMVHASDSPASSRREIAIFFK